MSKIAAGTFTHWEFSEREILELTALSVERERFLQNERARVAEQIINLEYNPRNPMQFAQDDAHLKGQLSILNWMLLASQEAHLKLANLADPT